MTIVSQLVDTMVMALVLAIEGESAEATWVEVAGLHDVEVVREETPDHVGLKLDTLIVIGTIIAVGGNGIKIGEFIYGIFQKRKESDSTLKVTLELPDGTRLVLENATKEDVAQAFQSLPSSRQ